MLELDFEEEIKTMTNEEYHSREEISCSQVKTILKCPYDFLARVKTEPSKSMDFGSCVHKLVLEPEDFDKEFAVAPDLDKRTKVGKELYEMFATKNEGKTILSVEEFDRAKWCSQIALEMAGKFFKNGKAEQSYFSELDGVPVRCRPDYYIEELGLIVDVKTSADSEKNAFSKSCANFGYHIQNAFYIDTMKSLGMKAEKFMFVVIETKYPFKIGLYVLDEASVELGRSQYKKALELISSGRIKEFDAPLHRDINDLTVVQTVTLPSYAYYQGA